MQQNMIHDLNGRQQGTSLAREHGTAPTAHAAWRMRPGSRFSN
jgi:hypothetical protein